MDLFASHGRALLSNGFLIVPIKPGSKRPANGKAWQASRLGMNDLVKYPGCGVGILCGQGEHPIAAVDIDTTNIALAEEFTEWCRVTLGYTAERVGMAPKILLPYRAAEVGWGKLTSTSFIDGTSEKAQKLEILSNGQQFVAYHIHPDTGLPYEWVDLIGGLEYMRASELPVITIEQAQEAVRVFESMALKHGLAVHKRAGLSSAISGSGNDDLNPDDQPLGLSVKDIKSLLKYIDNSGLGCEYDDWLKVGMALHHEFEGSDEALNIWDEWASQASKYEGFENSQYKWESFARHGANIVTARWLLKTGRNEKKAAIKAERREGLEEARELIKECKDSMDLVDAVAHKCGVAAGDDIAVKAELAGLLKARFKVLTGTTLSAPDVRAAMAGGKRLTGYVKSNYRHECTELGNTARMLDRYGEGLMYVPDLEGWFSWTGIYWRPAHIVELEGMAKETVRAMPDELKSIEDDASRLAFLKWCAASQYKAMFSNMIHNARSEKSILVPARMLDIDKNMLGVANGVVDLSTGKLLPPEKDHYITVVTDTIYKENAGAPLFRQTVLDVFEGDKELADFFQTLIGYSILGNPTEDIMVIPYGSGANGKSTIIGAIREALGKHAKTASSDTFLADRGKGGDNGGARPDVMRLRGARFVYVTEPEEGQELREAFIKSMTGGESMPARDLYSNSYIEIKPTWVVCMPTNHLPVIKGSDHAIWRRLLPLPFTRNFDKDITVIKDVGRAEKLKKENEGILRWCVEGALMFKKHGLCYPAKVEEARGEYQSEMDFFRDWLPECCDIAPGYKEPTANLWASWEVWAKKNGMLKYISSQRVLIRKLGTNFGQKSCNSIRYLEGLRLKIDTELQDLS